MADIEITEGDEFQQELDEDVAEVQGGDQPGDDGAAVAAEEEEATPEKMSEDGGSEDHGEASEAAHEGKNGATPTAEVANGSAAGEAAEAVISGAGVNSRDDDQRKIFVGGLHWETTSDDIREYFSKFGTVLDCTLKMDQNTGKSRGFGFVLFEDIAVVDKVIEDKSHTLHGRTIDPKRAQARGTSAAAAGGAKAEPIKKIFVGGLSPDLPEADIREYFGQYGKIEEVELPFDKLKNQRRAFCFISFESEECVDKAVVNAKQKLGDKEVDVRKATPKSEQDNFSGRGGRGGMQRGGSRGAWNGYGGGYGAPQGGYDYSSYYNQQQQPGYGAYQGYGGAYDYSGYYAQQQPTGDWSGYSQGYGAASYPGYDYSGYYASDPNAAAAATAAGATAGYKAKRGGGGAAGGAGGYHPYSR